MFSPERILNLLLLRSGNGKVRVSGGGGGMEKAMQEDVCMFLKHKHHGLNFDLGYAKLWPFCCVT